MTDTAANVEPAPAEAVRQVAAQDGDGSEGTTAGLQSEKAKAKAEAKAKAKAEKEAKKAANVSTHILCCSHGLHYVKVIPDAVKLLVKCCTCHTCRQHSVARSKLCRQKQMPMTL